MDLYELADLPGAVMTDHSDEAGPLLVETSVFVPCETILQMSEEEIARYHLEMPFCFCRSLRTR